MELAHRTCVLAAMVEEVSRAPGPVCARSLTPDSPMTPVHGWYVLRRVILSRANTVVVPLRDFEGRLCRGAQVLCWEGGGFRVRLRKNSRLQRGSERVTIRPTTKQLRLQAALSTCTTISHPISLHHTTPRPTHRYRCLEASQRHRCRLPPAMSSSQCLRRLSSRPATLLRQLPATSTRQLRSCAVLRSICTGATSSRHVVAQSNSLYAA